MAESVIVGGIINAVVVKRSHCAVGVVGIVWVIWVVRIVERYNTGFEGISFVSGFFHQLPSVCLGLFQFEMHSIGLCSRGEECELIAHLNGKTVKNIELYDRLLVASSKILQHIAELYCAIDNELVVAIVRRELEAQRRGRM